jgi:hypothetical protein
VGRFTTLAFGSNREQCSRCGRRWMFGPARGEQQPPVRPPNPPARRLTLAPLPTSGLSTARVGRPNTLVRGQDHKVQSPQSADAEPNSRRGSTMCPDDAPDPPRPLWRPAVRLGAQQLPHPGSVDSPRRIRRVQRPMRPHRAIRFPLVPAAHLRAQLDDQWRRPHDRTIPKPTPAIGTGLGSSRGAFKCGNESICRASGSALIG